MRRIAILLVLCVLLVACGKSEPPAPPPQPEPECYTNEDCDVDECEEAVCSFGQCTVNTVTNCCGNGQCELVAGEDRCNCPADCDEGCDGNPEFLLKGQMAYARYFDHVCDEGECIVRYDQSEVTTNEEYHSGNWEPGLSTGITISFKEPYEITSSGQEFRLEVELKDYIPESARLPLRLKEIRVLDGSVILGRARNLGWEFDRIGDRFTARIPVQYRMFGPEEPKILGFQFDYEVMKTTLVAVIDKDTGQQAYLDNGKPKFEIHDDRIYRSTANTMLQNPVTFVDPSVTELPER